MTTREKLLKLLKEFEGYDPSGTHMEAEELLLELLGDKEITAAWEEAMDFWWYS